MGKLPNFIVLPMAVSDKDGVAEFFPNEADLTSSLLPFNPQALGEWESFEGLKLRSKKIVPTIRLDTFLESMAIDRIDFLKIDTQGVNFSVTRSAGAYLERIREVILEVDIGTTHLYKGAAGRDEVIGYMNERGFKLSKAETQSKGKEQNLTFIPKLNKRVAKGSSANG
jgi:FkbM family methyltransferase